MKLIPLTVAMLVATGLAQAAETTAPPAATATPQSTASRIISASISFFFVGLFGLPSWATRPPLSSGVGR